MKIHANGKEVLLEKELTVKELLSYQNVEMQDYVTVQINDEFVDRENFETLVVKDGDVVEFLYFMGGGQREKLISQSSYISRSENP
ncbi:MAG: thiamine biosynthesis protein ThiS [Eubacterium sp.]|nr:thiamine biosynthesis protein ThiS [Eubacterium sp.]